MADSRDAHETWRLTGLFSTRTALVARQDGEGVPLLIVEREKAIYDANSIPGHGEQCTPVKIIKEGDRLVISWRGQLIKRSRGLNAHSPRDTTVVTS